MEILEKGKYVNEKINAKFIFFDDSNNEIELFLKEIKIFSNKKLKIVFVITTDYYTYKKLKFLEWFSLTDDSIDPKVSNYILYSHLPVEIDIKVKEDIINKIFVKNSNFNEIVQKIKELLQNKSKYLSNQSSFLYLDVLQEQETPSGTKFKLGYSSIYDKDNWFLKGNNFSKKANFQKLLINM